ncbi:MAG: hypothetical protein ACPLPX_02085 [Candidatus Kapaibacteriota bacterium]
MKKYFLLVFVWLIFTPQFLPSQTGMTISEFKIKLEQYFNEEMIEDVFKKIPQQTRFTVWGWDVGDFSGDNNPDLAFSIKILSESKKYTYVYMFVDIDGFLELVYVQALEYFELPLEIGVSIKNNTCSITQKKKKDFWTIKSYTFDNGILYLAEEYTSQLLLNYGLETTINYKTNECNFKIESLGRFPISFQTSYNFVPSYPRNKYVYKGFPQATQVNKVEYVVKGSYYWKGADDASFSLKSSFDNHFLYFTMEITDDFFVSKDCDKCIGDKVLFWFDFQPFTNSIKRMFKQTGNQLALRDKPDGNIFKIEFNLGNLYDKLPYVEAVNSNEPLDNEQIKAIEKIKIFFTTQNTRYILKVRIPFALFGFEKLPLEGDEPLFVGFNAMYVDVDNEFRPDEITYITNSSFDESKPSTFGELVLVPVVQKFAFAKNIYVDNLLRILEDFGF